MFVTPNLAKHLKMLNDELANRKYLCSDSLTAADILMSFPLIAGSARFDDMGSWNGKSWKDAFPNLSAYVDRIQSEEGYKASVAKIVAIDGKFESSL